MKTEVATWVATAVGSPLIVVILCWTLVIYHYHRRQWQPADLLVAAVIVQGIVKQVATFFYALLTLLQPFGCKQPLCSAVSWLLNSVHFLQAATLVTFTASRLLAVRYPHRYKQVVKRTHLTYHLVSLAMLATCIGIASVLAETKSSEGFVHHENTTTANSEKAKTRIYCVFLPHELDQRYAVMSIAMHSLLNLASIIMLVTTGFGWCLLKKQKKTPHAGARRPGQLLNSDASVMSDSSMGSAKQEGGLIVKENQFNPDEENADASMAHNIRKLRGESMSVITRNGFENGKHIATLIGNAPQNILTSRVQNNTPNSEQPLNSSNTCNYNYTFHNQNSHIITPTPPNIYKIPSISNFSNNTIFNSFLNDSNFEEIYDNIYAKHANEKTENTSRWATESSCISSSTSSTNSRAPCLAHQAKTKSTANIQWEEIRLSTAVAVLGLCYIFNHVPALILSMVGTFVSQLLPPNWPLHLVFFWTGMAEECLLPVILALFDENFSGWVHSTYTSDRRLLVDLARHHQGLDGRFRIFNPPLLDIQPHHQLHHQQQQVKFPITNGSLFTAVGGRHPVIHNYRRGTRLPITVPSNCTSSSVSSRDHYALQNSSGLKQLPALIGSQTSYTDESRKLLGDYRGFQMFKEFSASRKIQDEKNSPNMNLSDLQMKHSSLGCEEDLNSELTNFGDVDEPIYATLSSRSCCSATTAANDDFEFYQHEANAVACCKSSDIYSSDENVSNILEEENRYSPGNSACSHMVGESGEMHVDEFSKEKLIPQFQFEGQLHVCGKTSKYIDIVSPAVKEPNFKMEMSPTSESLLSAIENEIKNREQANKLTPSLIVEMAEQSYTNCPLNVSPMTTVGCDSSVLETQTVSKCGYCDIQKNKKDHKEILRDRGKKSITLSPYSHRRYISKGFLKSLSVDNFDELNEELNYHKDTDAAEWGKKCCSDYQKQHSVCEFKATERKELPGKSPTVILNQMPLLEDHQPSNIENSSNNFRELREKLPQFFHTFESESTVAQSFKQQKQPSQSVSKKRLTPVLSIETLLHVVNKAGVSYMDNGEICQHSLNNKTSTTDLRTVFVSDLL